MGPSLSWGAESLPLSMADLALLLGNLHGPEVGFAVSKCRGSWGETDVVGKDGRRGGRKNAYLVRVRSDGSIRSQVVLQVAKHNLPRDTKARDKILLRGRHGIHFLPNRARCYDNTASKRLN